ncbi:uncharacterized protein N7469_005766 [Penicillium citrinum]|uniref:Uncharacterized protein n=1 Tax=Penicillium citrinum TaxID=5077 RepID=A0A9W9P2N7_PENCI|nr:uncharacterized protein N7469_005766 [Penicillium citrinum]KAJ5234000.1 hypothetical protein N7469_005766 [Penicillium citrinum]
MATSNPKTILSSPQLLSAGGRCRFFTRSDPEEVSKAESAKNCVSRFRGGPRDEAKQNNVEPKPRQEHAGAL